MVDAGESSGVSAGDVAKRRGSIMQKAGRGHTVASSSVVASIVGE